MAPWDPLVRVDLLENLEGLGCLEFLVLKETVDLPDPKEVQDYRDQEESPGSLVKLVTLE